MCSETLTADYHISQAQYHLAEAAKLLDGRFTGESRCKGCGRCKKAKAPGDTASLVAVVTSGDLPDCIK